MCEAWAKGWIDWLRDQEATPQQPRYKKVGRFQNKLIREELPQLAGEWPPAGHTKSAKEEREAEDEAYPGGMRNPRKAVAASAGWRKWGAPASQALDEVLWAMPEGLALAETIGTELSPGDAEQARAVLERMGKAGAAALMLGVTGATQDWDERGPTRWRWEETHRSGNWLRRWPGCRCCRMV